MIVEAVAGYFIMGIVALTILDLLTKRVRRRLRDASRMTQERLIDTGQFVGVRMSVVLTLIALWLFWPFAIYAAVEPQRRKENDKKQKGH